MCFVVIVVIKKRHKCRIDTKENVVMQHMMRR